MTQDEKWLLKYNEVVAFIENNKRNPSKHDVEERGRYLNWMKHNRKLFKAGKMAPERAEMFGKLADLWEERKRKNGFMVKDSWFIMITSEE